jgi:hypothetical protein
MLLQIALTPLTILLSVPPIVAWNIPGHMPAVSVAYQVLRTEGTAMISTEGNCLRQLFQEILKIICSDHAEQTTNAYHTISKLPISDSGCSTWHSKISQTFSIKLGSSKYNEPK